MPKTDLPPHIANAAPPPAEYVACLVPDHLSRSNWVDHEEFSRKRNKTYWVLFALDESDAGAEGVYSRKAQCTAAMSQEHAVNDVVAGATSTPTPVPTVVVPRMRPPTNWRQTDVIRVRRPGIIRSTPVERKPDVKREVKLEVPLEGTPHRKTPVNASRRSASTAPVSPASVSALFTEQRAQRVRRVEHPVCRRTPAPPPGYTPAPETESDDEPMPPGTRSLYASDSDDDNSRPASVAASGADGERVGVTRAASSRPTGCTPAKTPCFEEVMSNPPSMVAPMPPSTVVSPSTSTESSLSASSTGTSTGTVVAPMLAGKGKERAEAVAGPSRSIPGSMHAAVGEGAPQGSGMALLTDIYYVGAAGKIHHSSEEAFADVSDGPVQVVLGWHAATRLGEKLVRKRAEAAGEAELAMDVDL
ncbi:hypothetical protein C8R43DRAFT_963326 [Mycena crocata]|nr:hypothetical protein C8R43DRAFT_963326 [Mycena crocata]